MPKREESLFARRNFLTNAALIAASVPAALSADEGPPPQDAAAPAKADVQTTERPGADFMIDVFKSLGFEYVCANPGSAFGDSGVSGQLRWEFQAGIHHLLPRRIVSRDGAQLLQSGRQAGAGFCPRYGGPAARGDGDLQCFLRPRPGVHLCSETIWNAATRRSYVDWVHSVQDAPSLVRDFTKFDDSPVSLPQFAESCVRAYKVAMTAPSAPVLLVADADCRKFRLWMIERI